MVMCSVVAPPVRHLPSHWIALGGLPQHGLHTTHSILAESLSANNGYQYEPA